MFLYKLTRSKCFKCASSFSNLKEKLIFFKINVDIFWKRERKKVSTISVWYEYKVGTRRVSGQLTDFNLIDLQLLLEYIQNKFQYFRLPFEGSYCRQVQKSIAYRSTNSNSTNWADIGIETDVIKRDSGR